MFFWNWKSSSGLTERSVNEDIVESTSKDTTNVVKKDASEELSSDMGMLSVSRPTDFTDLPAELRNQIYHDFLLICPYWKYALRFALVCRTVRSEFWPLYLEQDHRLISVRLDRLPALLDTFFPLGRPEDMHKYVGKIIVSLDNMRNLMIHDLLALLSHLRHTPGLKVEFRDDFWRWESNNLNQLLHTAKTNSAWERLQTPELAGINMCSSSGWGDYYGAPHRCHWAWDVYVYLKPEVVKGWGDDVEEHRRRIGELLDRMDLRGLSGLKIQVGTPSEYSYVPNRIRKVDWHSYW